MSPSTLRLPAATLMLAGISACGIVTSIRPHAPGTSHSSPPPGAIPTGTVPTTRTPTIGDRTDGARRTSSPDDRQVCRASAIQRGWIAVAYFDSPEQCPTRTGSDSASVKATAAIVTHYAIRPIGTTLDVCADENTPVGWATVTDESPEDVGRCPGAVRGEGPTTKRIRRYR